MSPPKKQYRTVFCCGHVCEPIGFLDATPETEGGIQLIDETQMTYDPLGYTEANWESYVDVGYYCVVCGKTTLLVDEVTIGGVTFRRTIVTDDEISEAIASITGAH